MSLVGDGYGSVFAAGNRALREAMMEQEAKRREDFLLSLKVQEMNRQALKDEQDARERQEDRAYGRQRDQKADADKERDRVAKQTREQRPGSKQELPGLAALDEAGLGSFVTNRNPGVAVQAGVPQDVLAFLPQSDPVSNAPVAPEVGPQDVAPAPVVAFEGGASGDYMGSPEYVEQTRREGVLKAQQDLQREDAQTQARELQAERLTSQQFIASENAAMRRDIAGQARLDRESRAGDDGKNKLGVAAQQMLSGIEASLHGLSKLESQLPVVSDSIGPLAGNWSKAKQKTPGVAVDRAFAAFSAESATLKNSVIKAITGAQMSEPEGRRILEQVPLETDKPEVWQAKAAATRDNLAFMARRIAANASGVSEPTGMDVPAGAETEAQGGKVEQWVRGPNGKMVRK
jgi:hypothetical protein